jgi:MFS family permease
MYTVSFADRVNMGVVLPVIRDEFGLTNMQAGELANIYFAGFLVAMLPFGYLLGRFGTRHLLGIAIIGYSACTYLIGTAASARAIMMYRIGLGVAEAPVATGGVTAIKNWHPKNEQATASGIYVFMSKNVWGIALGFCFIGFVAIGSVFWISAFLVEAKGMSFAKMGWVAAA